MNNPLVSTIIAATVGNKQPKTLILSSYYYVST